MGCYSRLYTVADSNVSSTALRADAAAELASIRKAEKYAHLHGCYVFKPIAIESLGSLSESLLNVFLDLCRRISSATGDEREGLFLFQQLSVILQRFNAILLHQSFAKRM